MPLWFTTLSLADQFPASGLESFLNEYAKRWLYILEHGQSGDNPHFHVIFDSPKIKRGDKLTQLIKEQIYNPREIKTNKRTVITNTDPVSDLDSFVPYYFFKEGKTCDDIHTHNFPKEKIEQWYAARTPGYIPKRITFDRAPYVLYETMKQLNPFLVNTDYKYGPPVTELIAARRKLMKDGYIVHHLISKTDVLLEAINDLWHNDQSSPEPNEEELDIEKYEYKKDHDLKKKDPREIKSTC